MAFRLVSIVVIIVQDGSITGKVFAKGFFGALHLPDAPFAYQLSAVDCLGSLSYRMG